MSIESDNNWKICTNIIRKQNVDNAFCFGGIRPLHIGLGWFYTKISFVILPILFIVFEYITKSYFPLCWIWMIDHFMQLGIGIVGSLCWLCFHYMMHNKYWDLVWVIIVINAVINYTPAN
jgi:hypothetical protein